MFNQNNKNSNDSQEKDEIEKSQILATNRVRKTHIYGEKKERIVSLFFELQATNQRMNALVDQILNMSEDDSMKPSL